MVLRSCLASLLFAATACDDVATVKVLLRHHVDLDVSQRPSANERRRRERGDTRVHHITIASVAAKSGMPPQMVRRLTCHTPAPAR